MLPCVEQLLPAGGSLYGYVIRVKHSSVGCKLKMLKMLVEQRGTVTVRILISEVLKALW